MRIAALDVGSNSFHLIVADVGHGRAHPRARPRQGDGPPRRLDLATRGHPAGGLSPRAGRAARAARGSPTATTSTRWWRSRRAPCARRRTAASSCARRATRRASTSGSSAATRRRASSIWARADRWTLGKRRVALFDLGGGSLEMILADAQELYFTASLKLGVIRLAESCPCSDPPTSRERAHLAERVPVACSTRSISRLRAMGFDFVAFTSGTAYALAGVLRTDKEAGSGKSTLALARPGGARAAARHACRWRRARSSPGSTPGARTRSTRARWCSAPRSSSRAPTRRRCARPALREGIIADYVAEQPPRHPAGR